MLARFIVLLWMSLTAATAIAHSTVKSTLPASGSILAASPAEIVIEFNEPARVISVVVEASGKGERKLGFAPSGIATTFTLADPQLQKGRNEIRWRALSKDGHPISGTIILILKPPAAESQSGGKPR